MGKAGTVELFCGSRVNVSHNLLGGIYPERKEMRILSYKPVLSLWIWSASAS